MSYDFTAYSGAITSLVASLSPSIVTVAEAALVIFGGLVAFGVGLRWIAKLAHAGH